MGPLQRYQLDLEGNAITADDAQRALVGHLQNLYEQIVQTESNNLGPLGWLKQRLFAERAGRRPDSRALYLGWSGAR